MDVRLYRCALGGIRGCSVTLRRGLRLSTLWRGLPRLRGEIHLPKLDCDYDRDILTPVVQHLRLRNPGVLLVTADRQHVAHSRGGQ